MRGKGLLIGGVVVVVIVGGALWAGRDTWAAARAGATYVAKQTCSCLFVTGRPMDSCKTDYEPDAIKPLTIEAGNSDVKVSALAGLLSTKAEFEQGFGCHPAN
jgi:hypothetical protein